MILLIGALLVASYCLFVFAADQTNPFVKPPAPLKRRRWRLARRCSATLLLTGGLFLANAWFMLVEGWWQLLVLGPVAAAMLSPAFQRFFRTRQWGKSTTAASERTDRPASEALNGGPETVGNRH